jgi:sulfur-carrier protein
VPRLRRAPDDHGLHRLRAVLRGHAGAGVTRVRIPPTLREQTGGERELVAEGDTVRDLLDDLMSRFPALEDQLPFANVYVEGEDVRTLDGLDTEVKPGTTVILLPAMAGGV